MLASVYSFVFLRVLCFTIQYSLHLYGLSLSSPFFCSLSIPPHSPPPSLPFPRSPSTYQYCKPRYIKLQGRVSSASALHSSAANATAEAGLRPRGKSPLPSLFLPVTFAECSLCYIYVSSHASPSVTFPMVCLDEYICLFVFRPYGFFLACLYDGLYMFY